MAPLNLDMLIAYSDDIYNAGPVRFLTNFDVYAMYGLVAVPATGDVVLAFGMHHSAYLVRAAQVAHADYLLGTYRPGALCRQLLDELVPVQSARVGIVGGAGMISKIDRDLRESLAGATLLDVSHRFEEAMLSGAPDTSALDSARRGAMIAARSLNAIEPRLHLFASELEIAAEVAFVARRLGADLMSREVVPVRVATGGASTLRPAALGRDIDKGGPFVAVEVAPAYGGMRSVCGRTYVRGNDTEAVNLLDHAMRAHRELCRDCRSGVALQEIFGIATAHFVGTTQDQVAEFGHGIGYGLRQSPYLTAESSHVLNAGELLAIRTRKFVPGKGTIHFADTVRVAIEQGEVLTHTLG
jgi:Xaa-Pro aminopeptidase